MARTRGSSALRTAVPVAGRDSTSSALAAATPSMLPKCSVWAWPTRVTTPMVGSAIRQSSRMWPLPRAPISTTTASASSAALARVSGTPISLLYDIGLALVRKVVASTPATRSLTVVLPTEPVMPTTRSTRRARAARPMAARAAPVSATAMAVAPGTVGPLVR